MIEVFASLALVFVANAFISTIRASNACECAKKNNRNWYMYHYNDEGQGAVEIIFEHYEFTTLRSWFGFRSWFYPFHIPMNVCDRINHED